MEERSRKFLSETLKLKSQYFGNEIMNKNYKQHLKNVHPNQDLSGIHGLSDMVKTKPQNIVDSVTPDFVTMLDNHNNFCILRLQY